MPWISVQRLRVVISIQIIPFGSELECAPLQPVSMRWREERASRRILLSVRRTTLVVFAPGPVHACIGIVLGLSGDRVAIAKQELLVGVVLEVVIAAHVDHRRGLRLCGGNSFRAVSE